MGTKEEKAQPKSLQIPWVMSIAEGPPLAILVGQQE